MTAQFQLDHLVVIVDDLAAASRDYKKLGFTVQSGGEHSDGLSQNALIIFSDGTYIELFTIKDRSRQRWMRRLRRLRLLRLVLSRQPPNRRRFMQSAARGEGLADFALRVTGDVHAAADAARAGGWDVTQPAPGGRARPDGVMLAWRLIIPRRRDVPFFIADDTSRNLRVPTGDHSQHANGVVGIQSLIVAVHDLTAVQARYAALLGPPADDHIFTVGATLQLASPTTDEIVTRHLRQRGPGPCAATLATVDVARSHRLDPQLTHNVLLTLAPA